MANTSNKVRFDDEKSPGELDNILSHSNDGGLQFYTVDPSLRGLGIVNQEPLPINNQGELPPEARQFFANQSLIPPDERSLNPLPTTTNDIPLPNVTSAPKRGRPKKIPQQTPSPRSEPKKPPAKAAKSGIDVEVSSSDPTNTKGMILIRKIKAYIRLYPELAAHLRNVQSDIRDLSVEELGKLLNIIKESIPGGMEEQIVKNVFMRGLTIAENLTIQMAQQSENPKVRNLVFIRGISDSTAELMNNPDVRGSDMDINRDLEEIAIDFYGYIPNSPIARLCSKMFAITSAVMAANQAEFERVRNSRKAQSDPIGAYGMQGLRGIPISMADLPPEVADQIRKETAKNNLQQEQVQPAEMDIRKKRKGKTANMQAKE